MTVELFHAPSLFLKKPNDEVAGKPIRLEVIKHDFDLRRVSVGLLVVFRKSNS